MSKSLAALAAGLATAVFSPCAAAPLETYGRLPAVESVSISPDGAMLALAVTNGEQRKVVIEQIEPRRAVATLNAGAQKVRNLQWAGPNHLILTVSSTGFIEGAISVRNESFLAADYDVAKKTQRPLLAGINENDRTTITHDTLNIVFGWPQLRFVKDKPIAFVEGVSFVNNIGRRTLFAVDLDRNLTSIESQGLEHADAFVVDGHGSPLAGSEYDAQTSRWVLKLWKGHWQEALRKEAPIELPELLGLGRDGASVLVGFFEGGHLVLRELSPDSGTWGSDLPMTDPDRTIWDPATYRLMGLSSLVGDDERYVFFDPEDQKIWKALVAAYPGARVTLASFSDNHRKFVLRVDSPTEGPAYALVDLNTRKGRWIGDEYQGLKSSDIAPVRAISYRAKDGVALTGYLTLPLGKQATKAPLVVLPHGGPAARDTPGFDWWAQALASRGYAVLQVNYRGSEGLGWDLQSAGFGQWGRKMQTDLSDGVRYLAQEGTIDPARVCIVGASYGGYAALAGAALDAGVYRCAASVAGPADLRKFIDWTQAREGRQAVGAERYWLRYMGAYQTLGEISPADQAAKVTVPILLIHGKDDTVVPYEQSQMMADALRKAGKSVEFVTLKSEDHWLSRGETRLQMLQSVVAFLEKNNPP
jgi:dienelactone hydrolase